MRLLNFMTYVCKNQRIIILLYQVYFRLNVNI